MSHIKREGLDNRSIKHNNDNCVACGICSDICPTSALTLGPILPIVRGILEMDYIRMDENKCVLCGLCSFACPFNVMEFKINNIEGKNLAEYPKWDHGTNISEDDCIFCRQCELCCPRDAIITKRDLPKLKDLVKGEIIKEVDNCISCHICEEMCPSGAITIKNKSNSGEGRFQIEDIAIDPEKCVYCKICQKVCPENALRIICTTCMDQDQIIDTDIKGDIALDDVTCINCGWCETICPSNAVQTIKPFEGMVILEENEEDEKICKGESCHACQDVCPCNAVTLSENKMTVNQDVCVLCGACEKACPQKILKVERTSMKLNNIKSSAWKKILAGIIK